MTPQYECNENYHNQYNTGNVYQSSDRFGVIQSSDLDFTCLEGQNDSYKLQETEVDKDDDIAD